MQLRALRQFSKQIVTHASIRRYRMLCALLPAVWLLFQVLGAGTAVIYSRFLPHSTFPAQLLWLAFLIGFRLVQLAATVPLQYQLLACCTSLAGLQAKTPYFLRTAYCLQLLTAAVSTRSAAGCMGVSLPANGSPPSCIQYRLGLLCPALPLCHAARLRFGNSVQSGTGGCSLLAIAASRASCSSHPQACRAKHAGTSAAPAANWRTGLAATSASLANSTHSFRMHPLL